ncbi:hypothetical protein GCM10007377_15820 [Galliscardovia ingluviei]|uniref:Uncharacterized protein n=1 Tax=Galliscardovia ingluviei TaxID=1769422 RepID=A0A8J3AR60_9BIFI|nr:hypothetical protein [Galliscardovia ingluviei]GGI15422.1 hypothetical protein GCM10007377_15820 [Galliscardovia ingluviei]
MNTWIILADGSASNSDGTTLSAEQVEELATNYFERYGEPKPKGNGYYITRHGELIKKVWRGGWEHYDLDKQDYTVWATGEEETLDWNVVLQEFGKDAFPVKRVTKPMLANLAQSPTEKWTIRTDGATQSGDSITLNAEQTRAFMLATLEQFFDEPKEKAPYAARNGDLLWKIRDGYWYRFTFEDSGDYHYIEDGNWEDMLESYARDDLPVKKLSKQLFANLV